MRPRSLFQLLALFGVAALVLSACGGSSKKKSSAAGGSGGTLTTLAQAAAPGSPDPQINYTLQEWQMLIMTHDGLTAFKKAGGLAGTQVVPDLATTIPNPTEGGKTYVFTLRKGIKFSDGTTLKASDVTRTFERNFAVHGPTAGTFYKTIVGAAACLKTPATCDLSKNGVIADDANNTVTFHLTSGDPEFLQKLAVPFASILPPSTPMKAVQIPPPGTGPYKFVEYNLHKGIKLVRNPFFKVWSKDAQPAGKPDVIIQKFGLGPEAEVTQVENGQADWMFDPVPADRLNELSNKFPDQVHINPLTADYYMAFNVRVPPFNNLDKIYGGPKLAVPSCQILPPNFPGYKPYCPYTKNPGSGKWTAPDLAKAKQLIAASGTKGASVKVNTDTTDTNKAFGLYFVGLLNSLGYKASLQALSPDLQYAYCQNSKNKVQFCWSAWSQDYPAASDFINILFGCSSFVPNSDASPNLSEYCNKSVQAQIDQALKQAITDPTGANVKWAAIDKEITDQAGWVEMFNPKQLDFTGKRVKGYQFSPQWYFLLDLASVK
ncbi:MAG: ABC transporter substrate-binding protein [Actinobacteria bacterium]|nr:MAG: ABC transporter substrate-binding protein [Actinomycetota bacterium]